MSHLTLGTCNFLKANFNPSNGKSVIVGNGSRIPVASSGTLRLTSNTRPLSLKNVLVTIDIIKNLISVRRFTRDNICSIEFDLCGFSIKNLRTKETLLHNDSTGDLYPVFPSSSINKNKASSSAILT